MKRHLQAGLISGMLLASGSALSANQINETEINNPIGYAQRIAMPSGSAEISAWIGNVNGVDVDYYTFYGTEGDVLTFDIDGGIGGAQSVDTIMAVFDVANGYKLLRMVDDAPDRLRSPTPASTTSGFPHPATTSSASAATRAGSPTAALSSTQTTSPPICTATTS